VAQTPNRTVNIELSLLKSWKLKIALLLAIITPAVSVTGAYYNLKADVGSQISQAQNKIDEKYVSKDSFRDMKEDVKDVREDVKEIKRFLMQRPGR
jgi:cell division protein FtsL